MAGAEDGQVAREASPSPLEQRIVELERRLADATLLHDRVSELEERRIGVSLDTIKNQLGHVEKRLGGVESRRDAWIRTLVLTLAVPVAAGVFGQVNLRRDVELKKFDQNLALVDRALDSSKGEAYRRSVLDYIAALNDPDAPIGMWAVAERDKLDVKISELEVQAQQQKRVVEAKQEELTVAQDRIATLRDEVQVATAASGSGSTVAQQTNIVALDQKIVEISATVEHANAARAALDVESVEANSLADRVGQGPVAPMLDPTEITANLPGVIVTEPAFAIQAGSYRDLDAAQARTSKLRAKGFPAFVLHRRKFFIAMVGPYTTESEAAQVLGASSKDFDMGARIRRSEEFCARQLPVDGDVTMCVE